MMQLAQDVYINIANLHSVKNYGEKELLLTHNDQSTQIVRVNSQAEKILLLYDLETITRKRNRSYTI